MALELLRSEATVECKHAPHYAEHVGFLNIYMFHVFPRNQRPAEADFSMYADSTSLLWNYGG